MNDAIKTRVVELAKQDAELYVPEFDEPFNPGATDWDTVQWLERCRTDLADNARNHVRFEAMP
jgi:hypothetical protein